MKRLLLKLVISGALIGLFLWRTPLSEIWSHLRTLDVGALIASAILSLVAWCLSGARLWCLLPSFRISELIRVNFASIFYGTILPGQIAGDVVKAYRLGRRSSIPGYAEAATLVDRVLALLAMFMIGAAAAFFTPKLPTILRLFFVAGALAIVLACGVAASNSFRHLLLERFIPSGGGRIRSFIRQFGIAMHDYLRRPLQMLGVLVVAVLFHLLCIIVNVLLGHALRIPLTWTEWALIYAGVTLLVLLPVSIAGIGLREGGYIGMLSLFGVSAAAALSMSFIVFGLALFGAIIGGLLELRMPWRRRSFLLHPSKAARKDEHAS